MGQVRHEIANSNRLSPQPNPRSSPVSSHKLDTDLPTLNDELAKALAEKAKTKAARTAGAVDSRKDKSVGKIYGEVENEQFMGNEDGLLNERCGEDDKRVEDNTDADKNVDMEDAKPKGIEQGVRDMGDWRVQRANSEIENRQVRNV
jgi:hypothetical protein